MDNQILANLKNEQDIEKTATTSKTREKIFSTSYLMDVFTNLFLYIVHFQLMLWSTAHALNVWHVSMDIAGLASGAFIIGALFARIPAGRYINYLGRRRVFLVGTALFFAIIFFYQLAFSPTTFIIVRLLHGISFGLSSTAASTIVATLLPQSRLGEGIGYFTLGVTIAAAIGPFLTLALPNPDWNIYICLVLGLLIFIFAFFIKAPEYQLDEKELQDLRSFSIHHFFEFPSLKISFIAAIGGICYSTVLSFLGAYANHLGLEGFGTTFFFIFFAITSLISRPITGRLLDAKGGDIVMYPALIFLALAMFVLAITTNDILLLTGALLLGFGYATITSACHALAVHCAPLSHVGVATSTYFVFLDAGIGVGPYVLGSIVNNFGFPAVYSTSGIISVIGIALYFFMLGRPGRFTKRQMQRDREAKSLRHTRREQRKSLAH